MEFVGWIKATVEKILSNAGWQSYIYPHLVWLEQVVPTRMCLTLVGTNLL